MGRKNIYCLVGKNKKSLEYFVFPEVGTDLEEIDLFTIKYRDNKELDKALKKDELDYFIFTYNKKSYRTYSVLYNNCKGISNITRGFKDKNISKNKKEIDSIYRDFCIKMKYSKGFRNYIEHERNDLYPKFIEYFNNKDIGSDILSIKDGGWVSSTYPLIRSVYYSLINYPIIIDNYNERDSIRKKLLDNFSLNIDYSYEEIINSKLELYKKNREMMVNKNSDTYYYDSMIKKLEREKDGFIR